MSFTSFVDALRAGKKPQFPSNAVSAEYAAQMDAEDELRHFRDEFIIPTKASLKKTALDGTVPGLSPGLCDENQQQLTIIQASQKLAMEPMATQTDTAQVMLMLPESTFAVTR